jgi:hypothetical protein
MGADELSVAPPALIRMTRTFGASPALLLVWRCRRRRSSYAAGAGDVAQTTLGFGAAGRSRCGA